jgi:hypothetical protein
MASVNKIILIGNIGRSEGTSSYLQLLEDALSRGLIKATRTALEALAWRLTGTVSADESNNTSALTEYQRACQLLHAALKALRNSGGCLKDLSGCNAPAGWQRRLLTSGRVAAFFHGRKVDARNLP